MTELNENVLEVIASLLNDKFKEDYKTISLAISET